MKRLTWQMKSRERRWRAALARPQSSDQMLFDEGKSISWWSYRLQSASEVELTRLLRRHTPAFDPMAAAFIAECPEVTSHLRGTLYRHPNEFIGVLRKIGTSTPRSAVWHSLDSD